MTSKKSDSRQPIRIPTVRIISKALNEARLEALEVHRKAKVPLVVWKDGKVVLIPPGAIARLINSKLDDKT